MEPITLNIDKKRIGTFIARNIGRCNFPYSLSQYDRFSLLGVKAAKVAQRLRQRLLGDAESCRNNLESAKSNNPVGYLALMVESAHLHLVESRGKIGLMARFSGSAENEDIDAYFDALMQLAELYNEGVTLLKSESGVRRTEDLFELLNALKEELLQVNRIYGKRQCFVATSVYGSEYAPQLEVLRDLRDTLLFRSNAGQIFIRLYYGGLGKNVAKLLARTPFLIPFIKSLLDHVIKRYDRRKSS